MNLEYIVRGRKIVLFLSHAEQDKEIASAIAEWLREKDLEVFRWEDPARPGGRFIKQIEEAINRSDAFIALLSPSFLASDWCGRETEFALHREQGLQAGDPDRYFIYVLQIVATPGSDAGFLRSYDWLDLTESANMEAALGELTDRLSPDSTPRFASSDLESFRRKPTTPETADLDSRGELAEELAKVFRNQAEAEALLEEIRYPRGSVPVWGSFNAPWEYWAHVLTELDNGRLPEGGRERLASAARNQYPGNEVFSRTAGELDWEIGRAAADVADLADMQDRDPSVADVAPRWVDPGFAHEVTRGRDMLGIRQDAVALAVLLSSSSLNPPLALGLYGHWGSGKTFFMQALDQEVHRLVERGAAGSCGKVTSVWFNAWQYAEGNLWASLTHHIFLSLNGDGPAPERVLDDALTTVQGVRDTKADAAALARSSEQAVARAQAHLTELQARNQKAKTIAGQVRGRDLLKAVAVDEQLRQSLNEAAAELGLPEAGTSAREIAQSASEVRSAIERTRSMAVVGPWWRSPLVLGLLVAGVTGAASIVIGVLIAKRHSTLTPLVASVGQLVALAGGVAAWLTRQSALVRKLLRPAERIQQQIDTRLAEQEARYRAESTTALEDLRQTEAELQSARQQLADAEERETAARLDLERLTGTRLLQRYLTERATTSDYGQYLGAVALAHRDLRDLDAYLQTAATDGADGPIDRIVLYIDDLDRCQPATVVQVLEAVNLLLSLPLFVVVVGVDARWLTRSLRDLHPLLLQPEAADTQATPADYLDKIFQLAYHLPVMTPESCAELLEYTALSTQPEGKGQGSAPDNLRSDDQAQDGDRDPALPAGEARHLVIDPTDPQILTEGTALELSEDELKSLRLVAPLVGSSPRHAKRFLNIYRIIKARALMDQPSHRLLTSQTRQQNPAMGLLLVTALAVGLPAHIPAALDTANATDRLSLRRWLEQHQLTVADTQESQRLNNFLAASAIPELQMRELLQWVPMVRRFAWPPGE